LTAKGSFISEVTSRGYEVNEDPWRQGRESALQNQRLFRTREKGKKPEDRLQGVSPKGGWRRSMRNNAKREGPKTVRMK